MSSIGGRSSAAGTKKEKAQALLRQNRLPEARVLFEEICAGKKADAESWFMLGAISGQLGLFDAAERCLRQAIVLQPSAEAWDNLGLVLQAKGRLVEAVASHQQALCLRPDFARACFNIGSAYRQMQDFAAAAENYRQAVQRQPSFFEALANLGACLLELGQSEEALPYFEQAARFSPGNPEISRGQGVAYQRLGHSEKAEVSFQQAVQARPDDWQAWSGLGEALLAQGKFGEALISYQQALRGSPANPDLLNRVGHLHQYMGQLDDAVRCFRQALQLKPDIIKTVAHLANTFITQARFDEAVQCLESALRAHPGEPQLLSVLANVYEKGGDHERAHEILRPLVDSHVNEPMAAVVFGSISRRVGRQDDAIRYIEHMLQDASHSPADRQQIYFVLGKLYEAASDYDRAFYQYRKANETVKQHYDPASQARLVNDLIAIYSADFMAAAPRASIFSGRPVFIVGMPRSGTSLVEQILASHPQVHGAGELLDIFDLMATLPGTLGTKEPHPHCLAKLTQAALDSLAQRYHAHLTELSADATRVTDKLPANFLLLGLIELLFPHARIIHCVRDPRDTCLSCYFQDFGARHTYSADLAHLGAYYREYERLMQHWKKVIRLPLLELRYEDIIADQEAWSRRLVEFCGLPWDDRCLRFHESGRAVTTASYDQVRQPMYQTSAGRWRHYEQHLGMLLKMLEEG